MEITVKQVESSRVLISGQATTVRVDGTVTISGEKKVMDGNGSFYRLSDEANIGSFNMYGDNISYNNMTDSLLTCDCVEALKAYVAAIETSVTKTTLAL